MLAELADLRSNALDVRCEGVDFIEGPHRFGKGVEEAARNIPVVLAKAHLREQRLGLTGDVSDLLDVEGVIVGLNSLRSYHCEDSKRLGDGLLEHCDR